jgi:hypothetical protein
LRLLASLALQNLGRRKARSLLLIMAVAVASGVVFTGATLMRSIDSSMAVGFTRLGADMMVVPEGALTNITAALLTVEPTDLVLDQDLFARAGHERHDTGNFRFGPVRTDSDRSDDRHHDHHEQAGQQDELHDAGHRPSLPAGDRWRGIGGGVVPCG